MCVFAACVYNATGGQKRESDPPELELPVVVSCHMGSWNKTRALKEQPVLLAVEPSLQLKAYGV